MAIWIVSEKKKKRKMNEIYNTQVVINDQSWSQIFNINPGISNSKTGKGTKYLDIIKNAEKNIYTVAQQMATIDLKIGFSNTKQICRLLRAQ